MRKIKEQFDFFGPAKLIRQRVEKDREKRKMLDGIKGDMREMWAKTIHSSGGHCPVCDRWGKVDARSITGTMALALIWMDKVSSKTNLDAYIDMTAAPKWIMRAKTYTTMKHWGLIERKENTDDSTRKHVGMWRVTDEGRAFIRKETLVQRKCFLYDDTVQGWSVERVSIDACLGEKFDYQAIMNDQFNWNEVSSER